jgi:hypothetical protein
LRLQSWYMTQPTELENRVYDLIRRYRIFIGDFMENPDNVRHYREQPNRVPAFYYNMFSNTLDATERSLFTFRLAERELTMVVDSRPR